MESLSIQPAPAGNPVDAETEEALTRSGDFERRADGSYRFIRGVQNEWSLVGLPTTVVPTVQRLALSSGGTVFWYSAIHTGEALFEYKRGGASAPSRKHLFAAVL